RRTQFETGAAAERKLAGRSFVENDTQSPEVAAVVARLASENLRRHVLQSAGQSYTCIKGIDGGVHGSRAGVSQIPLKTPGQAEIEDLDAAFRCGDDVGAFQVAVNDATTMRVSKSCGNLNTVAKNRLNGEAPSANAFTERLPSHQLHNDAKIAVEFSHFVNRANVRVAERR